MKGQVHAGPWEHTQGLAFAFLRVRGGGGSGLFTRRMGGLGRVPIKWCCL
jgi:hypothetical protein